MYIYIYIYVYVYINLAPHSNFSSANPTSTNSYHASPIATSMRLAKRVTRTHGRTHLLCVGEVAVVDEVDAQRAVDKERLRLRRRRAAGCRVAHVRNAHVACRGGG